MAEIEEHSGNNDVIHQQMDLDDHVGMDLDEINIERA